MNDCTNAEMRDQLPDLLHERLEASARAVVLAHVDGCVDCRDELQLLRDVRMMMERGVPRVDVAYVVGALPRATREERGARSETRRKPVWADWRIAAAITVLLASGGSFALMSSNRSDTAARNVAESVALSPVATVTPTTAATAATGATIETPTDSRLDELSDDQLKALLKDIGNMRAIPAAEPEPVTIQVSAKIGSEGI